MSESDNTAISKRYCEVFQMTAKERGKMAQTGKPRATFKYRQQRPPLVFSNYRKRSGGSYLEVWILAEEMAVRHKQRVTRNLARARARGVPEPKPAASKTERKRKLKETQRRIQEKKQVWMILSS